MFGSVCAYMLLALIFALAYTFLELGQPGSFRLETHSTQVNVIFDEMLYFSLVTVTTLGYGDVVPLGREARSLATAEAIFGQFYIAVVVGRLLSLYMEFHRFARSNGEN
ncbi:two pore domain potassium channel family protein [bacterium CPR1]|nr:two pore domain potassium channel family protein [bacterium CPR1]